MQKWTIERWHAGTQFLHSRPMAVDGIRRISILSFPTPAVVLGSTSNGIPEHMANKNFDVVRRWSGGGKVWLDPIESTWIDVTIPSSDPLWESDLRKSFLWLGQRLKEAFNSQGIFPMLHEAPLDLGGDPEWCFSKVGAGELSFHGKKILGISQRRSRLAARFQCVWYRSFESGPFVGLELPGIGSFDVDLGVDSDSLFQAVLTSIQKS
jgi:lipoate-protein ligase A